MIEKYIHEIRKVPLPLLKDRSFLTDFILQLGLFMLPEENKVPASCLPFCNTGLKIWQMPSQLADFLIFLSDYRIETYLESGVAAGGTAIMTFEYLSRFNPTIVGWGFDPYRHRQARIFTESHIIREYIQINPRFKLVEDFTRNVSNYTSSSFDLVFIDANHTIEGVQEDFLTLEPRSNMIAFHDILCQNGVMMKWQYLKQNDARFDYHEFCRLPKDFENPRQEWICYGIGLAVRNSHGKFFL